MTGSGSGEPDSGHTRSPFTRTSYGSTDPGGEVIERDEGVVVAVHREGPRLHSRSPARTLTAASASVSTQTVAQVSAV